MAYVEEIEGVKQATSLALYAGVAYGILLDEQSGAKKSSEGRCVTMEGGRESIEQGIVEKACRTLHRTWGG